MLSVRLADSVWVQRSLWNINDCPALVTVSRLQHRRSWRRPPSQHLTISKKNQICSANWIPVAPSWMRKCLSFMLSARCRCATIGKWSNFISRKLRNLSHFTVGGHQLSPVKHLYLKSNTENRLTEASTLEQIVSKVWEILLNCSRFAFQSNSIYSQCLQNKLAITCARYLNEIEKHCPRPSIRIVANRLLTEDDIQFVFETLESIAYDVLKE